jgi:acyl carrier protein
VREQAAIDDHQFELAELEAALGTHPGVMQAAAAVHGDAMGRHLVGYIVSDPGSCPQASDLRRHLSAALPGHPVPDLFVMIDRLPVTSGGEVDRQALSRAARGDGTLSPPGPAIVGGLAADVADIWREILGVDSVSLSDDLFDLGGHSLTITRISVRIRSRIGVDVPLAAFYDTPTVPGIVTVIEQIRCAPDDG